MIDDVWVFDFEEGGLGIYSVKERTFNAYHGKEDMLKAVLQLMNVKEAVSYNARRGFDRYYFNSLLKLSPDDPIPFKCIHTDMNLICYNGARGRCLEEAYMINCQEDDNEFSGELVGDEYMERDCYMTYKLWDCFRNGKLLENYGIENDT